MARLDDATRLVALALLNYADDYGYFLADPAAVRSFVRPFDDDSTIVRRSIATLSRIGYVLVVEHPEMGPIGKVEKFTTHQRVDRPNPSKLKVYFDSTNVRRLFDDQSSPEGKGKEKEEEKINTKAQAPFCLPDWVPIEKWEQFLEMRKKIRKSPTERAKELLVEKLGKLRDNGDDPGAVLDQSILNSWQGVFEVVKNGNGFHKYDSKPNGAAVGMNFKPTQPEKELTPEERQELIDQQRKLAKQRQDREAKRCASVNGNQKSDAGDAAMKTVSSVLPAVLGNADMKPRG